MNRYMLIGILKKWHVNEIRIKENKRVNVKIYKINISKYLKQISHG